MESRQGTDGEKLNWKRERRRRKRIGERGMGAHEDRLDWKRGAEGREAVRRTK